jgi:hypothetical protein
MAEDEQAASIVPDEARGPGLDRHRADDAIYQGFAPQPMVWGKGPDDLPLARVPTHLPIAPPLSPKTLVCLGDKSEYVLRRARWGEVIGRFEPSLVKTSPSGAFYVGVLDAVAAAVPWLDIARLTDLRTGRVAVEPLRPQCRYFKQQMTDFQDNTEKQFFERMCTARRDDESFFLSLRDSQVHACELREPPDPDSTRRIEEFNETKIMLGEERMRESGETFDVDAALKRERDRANDDGLNMGGIFADHKPTE